MKPLKKIETLWAVQCKYGERQPWQFLYEKPSVHQTRMVLMYDTRKMARDLCRACRKKQTRDYNKFRVVRLDITTRP